MNKQSTGGYSQVDYEYSISFPTLKQQQKWNMKVIRQRLGNFGIFGYAGFLIKKNYTNTSDGTLGWLKEGQFFSKSNYDHYHFIRTFFYPYGSNLRISSTISQIIWITMFAGILFSFFDKSMIMRILRMSVFGAILYLLIFEGGRSRYLIQFLPMISTLAVVGWHEFNALIRAKKWLHYHGDERYLFLGWK